MEHLLRTGRAFYGLGITCLGTQQFMYSDFRPVFLQEWPAWAHEHAIWAYLFGTTLIIAGALIFFGIKTKWVSVSLGVLLLAFFLGFQTIYQLFKSPYRAIHVGVWVNPLKELALSGGAFAIAGAVSENALTGVNPSLPIRMAERLIPLGRIFFSITMIIFGYGHFLYVDFVSDLVPAWIPGHRFWTYFSGMALIGAGLAIILKIGVRRVSHLLAFMLFLWVILLHIPRALANPYLEKGNEVTSVFEALAFCGIAIVIPGLQKVRSMNEFKSSLI